MPRSVQQTTPRGHPHHKKKKAVVTTVHPSGRVTGGTKKTRAAARASRKRVRRITAPPPKPTYVRPGASAKQLRSTGRGSTFHPSDVLDVAKKGYEAIQQSGREAGEDVRKHGYIHSAVTKQAPVIASPVGEAGLAIKGVKAADNIASEAKAVKTEAAAVEKAAVKAKGKAVRRSIKKQQRRKAKWRAKRKVINKAKAKGRRIKGGPGRLKKRPVRTTAKHPFRATAVVGVGSNQADVHIPVASQVGTAVTGIAKGTVEDPKKVIGTTARSIPGFVLGPLGIAAHGGITAARGVSAAAHEAGVPGAAPYSAKEIAAPAKKEFEVQKAGLEDFYKTYAKGSEKQISEATKEKYGLTPLAMALPGAWKVSKPLRAGLRAKRRAGRELKTGSPDTKRQQRISESTRASRTGTATDIEVRNRGREPVKHAKKARGAKKTVRKGVRAPGSKRKFNLVIHPGDAAPFLASRDINMQDTALATAQIERIANRLDPNPDLPKHELNTHDMVHYLQEHPEVMKDKNLRRAVELIKRDSEAQNHSEVARWEQLGDTYDAARIEERVPRILRGITRAKPERGRPMKEALEEEARKDKQAAKDLRKEGNRIVKDAKAKHETTRRGTLRSEVPEAEARGAARVRVAQRDRAILRKDEAYVEAVKANNRAGKELRALRKEFGVASNSRFPVAHDLMANLREAEATAKATRENLDRVKADVLRRAGEETSKKARGQKAGPLAELSRGPRGALGRLERRGGQTAERLQREREAEAAVGEARLARKQLYEDARRLEAEGGLKRLHRMDRRELEDEYLADVQRIAAEHGHEGRPAFVSQLDVRTRVHPAVTSGGGDLPTMPAGVKRRTGALQQKGAIQEGLGPYIRGTIRNPVARRNIFSMWRNFFHDRGIMVNGRREFSSEQIGKMFDDENAQHIDPRYVAAVDRHLYKKLFDDLAKTPDPGKANELYETFLNDMRYAMTQHPALQPEGRQYMLVPKSALKELTAHGRQHENTLVHGLSVAQNFSSRAILGTSPAWAVMQVIAENAQAASAVGPIGLAAGYVRAHKIFKNATDEQKVSWQTMAGEVPGAGQLDDIRTVLSPNDARQSAQTLSLMNRTRVGQAVKSVARLDALVGFDRWKASVVRRAVAAEHVHKLNREVNGFTGGIRKLWRAEDQMFKELKGLSQEEQVAWIAKHPKAQENIAQYVDDVMGNWSALTKFEHDFAPALIFYPFIRMSLRWTFRTFPKRHPIRAAVIYYLGQANAVQLHELLQGDPSFYTQWGQVPLYTSDDQAGTMDLSRAGTSSNALVEALGSQPKNPLEKMLNISNPVIKSAYVAITGHDPFTDEQHDPGWDAGVAAAMQLLAMPTPMRLLDQTRNLGDAPGPLGAVGKFAEGKISDSETPPLRGFVAPFLPQGLEKAKKSSRLGRLFDAIAKAPEVTDYEGASPEKTRQLDKAMAQAQAAQDALTKIYPESPADKRAYEKASKHYYETKYPGKPSPTISSSYEQHFGGAKAPAPTKVKRSGSSGTSSSYQKFFP